MMKNLLDWSARIRDWSALINKRLGTRVIVMLWVALSLSVVAVIFTDTWIASIAIQDKQIALTRDNIAALYQLRTNLFKAESAQRGFVLTQRAVYLGPFEEAVNGARENIKKIEGLVTHQADIMPSNIEKEWILSLSAPLEAKISEMQLTIYLAKQGEAGEAKLIVLTNNGLASTQKLIEVTQQLLDAQNKALMEFRAHRESTIGLARASVYGSALILILLVILVIRQLLQEMEVRDQLREQLNIELENYESQLEERTQLLKALALDNQADVERERQKLARELHDELGSILTATKMDVSWSIRKLKETNPEISEKLSKTIRYLDQGIQFKRQVVQNLSPAMIDTFGFWPALRNLIDDLSVSNEWEMDVILPSEDTQLRGAIGLIAYRVVQETLNNASKYAKASKVSVHMMVELDYLKIEIEDNGVGFDVNAVDNTRHGLSGMRNRVTAIGGHFEISSVPGEGTISRIMIHL